MRWAGILIALLLFGAACNGKFVRTNTTEPSPTTKNVGSTLATGFPSPTPARSGATNAATSAVASFTLTVTDRNGNHPPGIPVSISGATTATQLTDANGRIKLTRPGIYHFLIATGCGSELEILSGANGTAGVVAGQPSSGELKIDWLRRYTPNAPMFSNPGPPWPIGGKVDVQYSVTDRCKNAFAPNVAFTPLVFSTSSNLRVIGTPTMRSDSKHLATLTVECLSKGDVKLTASDKYNPKDSFDLIRFSADYEPPRCG